MIYTNRKIERKRTEAAAAEANILFGVEPTYVCIIIMRVDINRYHYYRYNDYCVINDSLLSTIIIIIVSAVT